jgi:hypothetical protein
LRNGIYGRTSRIALRLDATKPVIYILAGAVLIDAAARIYARIRFGDPGTAGTLPVVIEIVLPILLFTLLPFVSKND